MHVLLDGLGDTAQIQSAAHPQVKNEPCGGLKVENHAFGLTMDTHDAPAGEQPG